MTFNEFNALPCGVPFTIESCGCVLVKVKSPEARTHVAWGHARTAWWHAQRISTCSWSWHKTGGKKRVKDWELYRVSLDVNPLIAELMEDIP